MIDLNEETSTHVKVTYTVPHPDTSNITGTIENGIATFVHAGGSLSLTADALPAFMALVASINAASVPRNLQPEPVDAPEEDPILPPLDDPGLDIPED